MTELSSVNSDVFILIGLFLNDKDICALFSSSRTIQNFSRLPGLWKARALAFMPALHNAAMVSVFRRDIAIDGFCLFPFDWMDRYRSARMLHPKGFLISSDMLSWFDVSGVEFARLSSPKAKYDPDSDIELGEVYPDRFNVPGTFLNHFFHRFLQPNEDTIVLDGDDSSRGDEVAVETDEGRAIAAQNPVLSLSRFIRLRSNPGAFQESSQFLHGRLVAVDKLIPSSSRARKWARSHRKDPIQKLARYHRYGMFWLQIDHDDMSFRADKSFLRPSGGWVPGDCRRPLISYFECTILRQPMAVGIGLCDEQFHSRTPGVFIGWPASPGASYGFHGDDGLKFHNDGRGQEYSGPYGAGDTIGCGLDWSSGSIFFTKNGEFLGEAFNDVHIEPGAKWFPTVSLKHILSRRPNALKADGPDDDATDAVAFNSGTQGILFVYDLGKHIADAG